MYACNVLKKNTVSIAGIMKIGYVLLRCTMALCGAVLLLLPKYRLALPENYLFSLSIKNNSGSRYPKKILFNSENRSTAAELSGAHKGRIDVRVLPYPYITRLSCHQAVLA